MTEEEMKKRLLKTLERDDKRQLNLPFGQDEADDSPHSLLMPDMEEKHAPLSQREFLMGKISQIED